MATAATTTSRWLQRLETIRRESFIGREAESALFVSALTAPQLPFLALYIHGPGGVGKSSLMRQLAHLTRSTGAQAHFLDGRNVEPTPDVFMAILRQYLGIEPQRQPYDFWAESDVRHVLLLDTYELMRPLDGWLRDHFLPNLPDNVLVVLAGRNPPSIGWREDPAWQTLMRVLTLHNLSPEEARTFLIRRAIPTADHHAVLRFTHGHPLALSLVADVFAQQTNNHTHFHPEEASDIIAMLVERLAAQAPGPLYRAALEAAVLVRVTTESLLSVLLDTPNVQEVFAWLRDLSLMDASAEGIFPHDMAREALAADVRWRKPDWYATINARARNYYKDQMGLLEGRQQRRMLINFIYLHRENPLVKPYFDWQRGGSAFTDRLQAEDVAEILEMIEQHEGKHSAEIAHHWLAQQPEGASVIRSDTGKVVGALLKVAVERTNAADAALDPFISRLQNFLATRPPLLPKQTATCFRFWLDRETYQIVSPIQSRIFLNMVQHYMITSGLAFTFLPCSDPDFWLPVFSYADLARTPELDFVVGGRKYGVYMREWRTGPPTEWLNLIGEREFVSEIPQPTILTQELTVLNEKAFTEAVREALKYLNDPLVLGENPLVHTGLIEASEDTDRVVALQEQIRGAIDKLQHSPRQRKLHRALYHTYVQAAASQEAAAELLDLPFSTYRRHLRQGVKHISTVLWRQYLDGRS